MWSHLTKLPRNFSAWMKGAMTPRWVLAILILASFAVRLHDLGTKSLWADEGMTLRRAQQPPGLIFKNLNLIPITPDYHDGIEREEKYTASSDLHPPLYFLLIHLWILVAGQSEFALRFPSVVAATLTLPLIYALGRALLSEEAGLWAALLAALSPFYTWHAQEARMYGWVVVLSLASIYSLLPLLRKAPRPRDYVVYAAVTAALLYTNYSGFFLLGSEALVYGVYILRKRPRRALVALAVLVVAVIPLAPHIRHTLQRRTIFPFAYRPLHLILSEVCSYFSLGPGDLVIRPIWQMAPFLALLAIGVLMLDVSRRRWAWVICLGFLMSPVLLQYVTSFFRPSYVNPRQLTVISPLWELVMAQGLVTLRRRLWPALVPLLGAALLLRGQATYDIFTAHGMWKDDIRGAVEYIEARARPGDAIILHDAVIRLTFDYYYDGPYPETAIPQYTSMMRDAEQAQAEFAAWAQQYDRIWFLYGPPPIHFPHDLLPGWADASLFKICQQRFEAWWTYVAVAAYDDGPPLFDALPADTEPRDLAWGPLRLVGFGAPEAVAGENEWLAFYWQVEGDPPDEPLTLIVRLRDEAGTPWLERSEQVLPFYPPAEWPADHIVQTEFRLPLPDDMPPINYAVELEPVGLGGPEAVGQMSVTRPSVREPVPHPSARFEGGVELLASELADGTFRSGYPLLGSLTWRAAAAPTTDLQLRVRLTDLLGREVASGETVPSAAGFPSGDWLPDDRVAGRLVLPLPADLKSGRYRVQVGLVDGADGAVVPVRRWYGERDWVTVGAVRVEAWPLVTELPDDVEHLLGDVQLADRSGGVIHLRGYDLARDDPLAPLRTGDTLALTLYWQANEPPGASYHVFVHVGAPDAAPVAQADGVPGGWLRPTTTWRAGEVIADTYTVSLAGISPGQYSLLVGLYDSETGQRPTTVVNGEVVPGGYVLLQEIEVGE
jgi:mannosyltransferase